MLRQKIPKYLSKIKTLCLLYISCNAFVSTGDRKVCAIARSATQGPCSVQKSVSLHVDPVLALPASNIPRDHLCDI